MILLAVGGRPALRRLFVYRVVGAALVAPDECRDLSRDTDGEGPPISSHARAIPIRKQTITSTAIVFTAPESPGWVITLYSLDQLDHERDGQPDQEQRMPATCPTAPDAGGSAIAAPPRRT